MIELLRASVKVGHRFIQHVKVTPRTKTQKRMSMTMYNNLVQKGDSLLALVDAEKAVGMELIARSAFENYIDLINLFRHRPQYLQYVLYMSSVQQVRGIERMLENRESPFSTSIISKMPGELGITIEQALEMTKEERAQYRSKLSRVYTDGNKPISEPRSRVNTSVWFRSELAGRLDLYESMFRLFSRSTHSDVMAMLKGVVKEWEFVWPPEQPEPSTLAVDALTMMIHETSEILVRKLRKPFPAVKKMVQERRRIHTIWS
ncbi:MAG TPA: DUF5677 domain-containing protein [Woeseiaceae bacterium]|nr:DUF5677 domain-containing protein [Woeseiaceae bacterium]